jgi:hypothetical protein
VYALTHMTGRPRDFLCILQYAMERTGFTLLDLNSILRRAAAQACAFLAAVSPQTQR